MYTRYFSVSYPNVSEKLRGLGVKMLRVCWVEVGSLPSRLKTAVHCTGHDVVDVLSFPGPGLRRIDLERIYLSMRGSDALVLANTPHEVRPMAFGSVHRFIQRVGKVLVRLENHSRGAPLGAGLVPCIRGLRWGQRSCSVPCIKSSASTTV